MKKLIKLGGVYSLVSLFAVICAFQPTSAQAAGWVEIGDLNYRGEVKISGTGFYRGGKSYQVNFYVNHGFVGQTTTNSYNGKFHYTLRDCVSNGDLVTVKVLQYHSQTRHKEVNKRVYRHGGGGGYGKEWIDFSNVNHYGVVTLKGRGFTKKHRTYQVNIYVNNKFVDQTYTHYDGTFRYETRPYAVGNGDLVIVKVLQYKSPSRHHEVNKRIYSGGASHKHRVELTRSWTGKVVVTGQGFKKDGRLFDVNIYVDDKFKGQVKTTRWGGLFSYTIPGRVYSGQKVTVKVLQYYGRKEHLTINKWVR